MITLFKIREQVKGKFDRKETNHKKQLPYVVCYLTVIEDSCINGG